MAFFFPLAQNIFLQSHITFIAQLPALFPFGASGKTWHTKFKIIQISQYSFDSLQAFLFDFNRLFIYFQHVKKARE